MATTVLRCPRCQTSVRLREGESTVQCTGCGASVVRRDGSPTNASPGDVDRGGGVRQMVLSGSFVLIAGALVSLGALRHHRSPPVPPVTHVSPIFTAPEVAPIAPTPEGELAWEPHARGPLIAAINGDAVEDVFGFFRLWDGRSAWVAYAGAFDGATLRPLWRTDPLDPQLLKIPGVMPFAVVAGARLVVADTSPTLRVFMLSTGEKLMTLKLDGQVIDVCRSPDQAARIWVHVQGDSDSLIDLETSKADLAPRPKWCPARQKDAADAKPSRRPSAAQLEMARETERQRSVCTESFLNGANAVAACRVPDAGAATFGVTVGYELDNGNLAVGLGTKDDKPFAVSLTKGSPWSHGFVSDDTKPKAAAPSVADVAFGRLYAVYEKIYFDARLSAVDAKSGEAIWDSPLVGSVPAVDGQGRGEASGLVATPVRVYVVRMGGGLDVFDASSGKAIGTIGKQ